VESIRDRLAAVRGDKGADAERAPSTSALPPSNGELGIGPRAGGDRPTGLRGSGGTAGVPDDLPSPPPMIGHYPTSFHGGRKGLFILLRYLFIISASYLVIFGAPRGGFGAPQALMVVAALASNMALSVMRPELVFAWYVEAPVLIADTLWVSWALQSTGAIGQEFFLLYFFVLFLAAVGGSVVMVLLGSTLISVANVYFINPPHWTSAHLLRIVFFYAVALFYGNVLGQIKRERQRANKEFTWAKELKEQVAERTEELRRSRDQAQVANRLKSEFIATMSHELLTPLNIIMGYTDLFTTGEFGDVTAQQIRMLGIMSKYQRDLLELINAILNVGRLEAGRLTLEPTRLDLAALLQGLEDETRLEWAKPDIQCIWNVSPDLPPLYTDPGKLKTVLKNLIRNATKFTPCGSVTITARPNHTGIEIAVSDTGIGIPEDKHDLIFEAFRQVDGSATRCYAGVGLGLHIVRRLVGLMEGAITVESEAGRGSTFRVWLPISTAAAPPVRVAGNSI
jgi:signal transduction histidine kinase